MINELITLASDPAKIPANTFAVIGKAYSMDPDPDQSADSAGFPALYFMPGKDLPGNVAGTDSAYQIITEQVIVMYLAPVESIPGLKRILRPVISAYRPYDDSAYSRFRLIEGGPQQITGNMLYFDVFATDYEMVI